MADFLDSEASESDVSSYILQCEFWDKIIFISIFRCETKCVLQNFVFIIIDFNRNSHVQIENSKKIFISLVSVLFIVWSAFVCYMSLVNKALDN